MQQNFDKEKTVLDTAKIRIGKEHYEIILEPANTINYLLGEIDDIRDVLVEEVIYHDALTGEIASETKLEESFQTTQVLDIAKKILMEGKITISEEHKEEQRKKLVVEFIDYLEDNCCIRKTNKGLDKDNLKELFHHKIKIDVLRPKEEQLNIIKEEIKKYLDVDFEDKIIDIKIPSLYAAKTYGYVSTNAEILDEAWLSDGSWSAKVKVKAGKALRLIDELNNKTRGETKSELQVK